MTGNLSEDCTTIITMFNPSDEKYGIKTHFGHDVEGTPGYRSLHVVQSRNGECPLHLGLKFDGKNIRFKELNN